MKNLKEFLSKEEFRELFLNEKLDPTFKKTVDKFYKMWAPEVFSFITNKYEKKSNDFMEDPAEWEYLIKKVSDEMVKISKK